LEFNRQSLKTSRLSRLKHFSSTSFKSVVETKSSFLEKEGKESDITTYEESAFVALLDYFLWFSLSVSTRNHLQIAWKASPVPIRLYVNVKEF
jgi:hypothetical protein